MLQRSSTLKTKKEEIAWVQLRVFSQLLPHLTVIRHTEGVSNMGASRKGCLGPGGGGGYSDKFRIGVCREGS